MVRELGNPLGNPLGLPSRKVAETVETVTASAAKIITNVSQTVTFSGATQVTTYTPLLFGGNRLVVPYMYNDGATHRGYRVYDIDKDANLSNMAFTADDSNSLHLTDYAFWQYNVSQSSIIAFMNNELRKFTLSANAISASVLTIQNAGTYTNLGTYTSQQLLQVIIVDSVIWLFCKDNNDYLAVQKYDFNFNLLGVYKTNVTLSTAPTVIYKTDFGFLLMYIQGVGTTSVVTYFKTFNTSYVQIQSKSVNLTGPSEFGSSFNYFDGNIASAIVYKGPSPQYGYHQMALKVGTDGIMTTSYTTATAPVYTSFFGTGQGALSFSYTDTLANLFGVNNSFYGNTTIKYDGQTRLPSLKHISHMGGVGSISEMLLVKAKLRGVIISDLRLDLTIPISELLIIGQFASNSYVDNAKLINETDGFVFCSSYGTGTTTIFYTGVIK